MEDYTKKYDDKMSKSVDAFDNDLNTIRVGRANPRVLDKILVDAYGTLTPINQLGNISVPEPRTLQIQPWDSGVLKSIEKAISSSDIGINPSNDGKLIRLSFPELTEDRRKDLAKDVKKKGEVAKVAIRNIRREAIDEYKKLEKKSELTEDELKRLEDEIQKVTDAKTEQIDKIVEAKNKEIMSI